MSYYKEIDGKKYDGSVIDEAEKAVAGAGDGRISINDAQKILQTVKDGDNYTDIEKETMSFIRTKYKWTEEADNWFRAEIAKWAATK